MDAQVQKKRLNTMIAIDVVCLALGAGSIIGHVAVGVKPLRWAFVACAAVGVGAQLWFLAGLFKSGRAS